METKKSPARIFLVLVPHRDIRLVLRRYSETLFEKGFSGAYLFPWVAPLAEVPEPLTNEELKQLIGEINREREKINTQGADVVPFPAAGEGMRLFGPKLACLWRLVHEVNPFSPTVLGSCLLSENEDISAIPPPPQLSFRAAALATMSWQKIPAENNSIGYEWKIGKLHWLPKSLN